MSYASKNNNNGAQVNPGHYANNSSVEVFDNPADNYQGYSRIYVPSRSGGYEQHYDDDSLYDDVYLDANTPYVEQYPEETTPDQQPGNPTFTEALMETTGLNSVVDSFTEDPVGTTAGVVGGIATALIPGATTAKTVYTLACGTEEEKKQLQQDIKEHPWYYAFDTALDVISLVPMVGTAAAAARTFKAARATKRIKKEVETLNKLKKAAEIAPRDAKQQILNIVRKQEQIVAKGKKEVEQLKHISKSTVTAHNKDVISKATGQRGKAKAAVKSVRERAIDIKKAQNIKKGKSSVVEGIKARNKKRLDNIGRIGAVNKESKKLRDIERADKATRSSLRQERKAARESAKQIREEQKNLISQMAESKSQLNKKALQHLDTKNAFKNTKPTIGETRSAWKQMRAGDKTFQENKRRLNKVMKVKGLSSLPQAYVRNRDAGLEAYDMAYGEPQQKFGGQKRTSSSKKQTSNNRNNYFSPLMALADIDNKKRK